MNPTEPAVRARAYFPSIDILRGFAALSVVMLHVIVVFEWESFPSTGPLAWFRYGWMGVDLFFVISGFVIGLAAFKSIDKHGPQDFRAPFMRRRIARIAPLHYLTVAAFIVLVSPSVIHEQFALNISTYLLFVHNLFPRLPIINSINWTLAVEMQFYLLMLWLAPRLLSRHGLWLVAGMLILAWTWRLGVCLAFPAGTEDRTLWMSTWATQLPGMLDEFAIGLIMAYLVMHRAGLRFLISRRGLVLSVLAFLICAWLTVKVWVDWNTVYWEVAGMTLFFRSLLGLTFAFLIAIACGLNGPLWLKLTGPFRYLGRISYGIYLWHLMIIMLLHRNTDLDGLNATAVVIACTIAVASASWHLFEKPIIDRYSRK